MTAVAETSVPGSVPGGQYHDGAFVSQEGVLRPETQEEGRFIMNETGAVQPENKEDDLSFFIRVLKNREAVSQEK